MSFRQVQKLDSRAVQTVGLARSRRRGITLLEVLISMFIMTVGLMSVAALVPVGRFEILEAAKSDRSSALARRVYNELRIRGMLDPRMRLPSSEPVPMAARPTTESQTWADATGGPLRYVWNSAANGTGSYVFSPYPRVPTDTAAAPAAGGSKSSYVAFALDPLGVAAFATGPSAASGAVFPYGATLPVGLSRITLWPDLNGAGSNTQIRGWMTGELFRSNDELVFGLPPSESAPADQKFSVSGTQRLKRQSEGDYSYLVTMVPDPTADIAENLFTVSVVVFYKRDLVNPGATERVVKIKNVPYVAGNDPQPHPWSARFASPDWEMRVELSPSRDQAAQQMAVKPGQYIMLCGAMDSKQVDPAASGNPPPTPNADPNDELRYKWNFKWYRVVAAQGEVQPATEGELRYTRQITLAGPDWNVQTDNNKYNNGGNLYTSYQTRAFLIDGVIGVYERTMRFDGAGSWNNY